MPRPSSSLATLRPDLALSLTEFDLAMNRAGFIAQKILPVIDVRVQSDTFGKIPLKELLKNAVTARASGSGYNRIDWKFTTDSFATAEHGAEVPIDDREANIYANYIEAELASTALAEHIVLLNQEKRVAALLYNTSTFTPTSIVNEWDDYANAAPIDDVLAAKRAVWDRTGLWPDSMTLNRHQFQNLQQCEQIHERVSASGAGDKIKPNDLTVSMIAMALDLQNLFIGDAAKNTAAEGAAAVIDKVWSDEYVAIFKRVDPNSPLRINAPGLGRIFHYTGDGSMPNCRVETYREEQVRADIVRVRHEVHEKLLHTDAVELLDNVTT